MICHFVNTVSFCFESVWYCFYYHFTSVNIIINNMDVLKKRQRFTDHDDLVLLREVLSQNPFQSPSLWEVIQEHVFSVTGKTFSIRTLKEHLERLIKLWLEQYTILKNKSGIEIQVTEKESLIHNIFDMMKEFKDVTSKKRKLGRDHATTKVLGVEARNKWTKLLEESSTITYNSTLDSTHSVIHDHGLLVTSSAINEVIVDGEFELDIEEKENKDIEPSANVTSLPPSGTTPKLQHEPRQTSMQSLGTPSASNSSKILGSVRSRKRKINTQRQGLAYLEEYDKAQAELKRKELDIEERKLILEERKMHLMEKQHSLAEFQIKKQLELEEKKINLEIQSRDSLVTIVERQDKLLKLAYK